MAKESIEVVEALRKTAEMIEKGSPYMWGHMGSCNCGNLAQVVTKRTKAEIHAYAMQGSGDWNEQVANYCGETKMPIDIVIFEFLSFGFTSQDLQHLEKLSDPEVINAVKNKKVKLLHNQKEDVSVYLRAWADLLEEKLINSIKLPTFVSETPLEYV
jgi:hypothetical protein